MLPIKDIILTSRVDINLFPSLLLTFRYHWLLLPELKFVWHLCHVKVTPNASLRKILRTYELKLYEWK
jgi:hypothetical protein